VKYPHWSHEFWDSMDSEKVKGKLGELVALEADRKTFVFGWSLGSLVLHQWLMDVPPPPDNFLFASINPVFDFCAPEAGWSRRVLEKMKKKLIREKNTVAMDFFQSMVKNVDLTERQIELWDIYHDSGHNAEELSLGLSYLSENKVDMQEFLKKYPNQILFRDEQDPISPVLKFDQVFPQGVVSIHGHVPFLTESEKIIQTMEQQ